MGIGSKIWKAGCENLQPAKFRRLRNSAGCENFVTYEILQVVKFFTTLQKFTVAHFLFFFAFLSSGF